MIKLFYPSGELSEDGHPVQLTPTQAGWSYCGMRVLKLEPNQSWETIFTHEEAAVVPLHGSATVDTDPETFELSGRESIFTQATDLCFLGLGSRMRLTSPTGGEFVVATARTRQTAPNRHYPSSAQAVELRGAGQATRQINNLLTAEVPGPTKLLVVEVITPAGNWPSFPPHKHDQHSATERELEEIYYFRIRAERSDHTQSPDGEGFGLHRTYTKDRSIDQTVCVRDGDVFLVPRGFHGPCVAAPGYDMYYLNVMAGPAPGREWLITTDPDFLWLSEAWSAVPTDPRLPYIDNKGEMS